MNLDLASQLKQFCEENTESVTDRESYQIDSLHSANYYLQLVLDIKQKIESIKTFAKESKQASIDKIDAWADKEINTIAKDVVFYEKLLEDFTKKELEGSKKKTLSLPNGKISFRKSAAKYVLNDNEKELLINQLKENEVLSNLVKTEVNESINLSEIKKASTVVDNKVYIEGIQLIGLIVEQSTTETMSIKE